jgi:hypothetical protein
VKSPHDNTMPVPLASIVQRWQTAWQRLYLAEQHGLDPAPTDLLTELQSGAHIAQLVTHGRWLRVITLLRATGVDSWPQIAHTLNMSEGEARDEFVRWATDQTHDHRTTGRGLAAAEAREWIERVQAVRL